MPSGGFTPRGRAPASPPGDLLPEKPDRRKPSGPHRGQKVGKAVVRNKVRRRIREIYRTNEGRIRSGYDIVVVARVRAVFTPYAKLEDSFLKLMDKLGLLRGEEEAS